MIVKKKNETEKWQKCCKLILITPSKFQIGCWSWKNVNLRTSNFNRCF